MVGPAVRVPIPNNDVHSVGIAEVSKAAAKQVYRQLRFPGHKWIDAQPNHQWSLSSFLSTRGKSCGERNQGDRSGECATIKRREDPRSHRDGMRARISGDRSINHLALHRVLALALLGCTHRSRHIDSALATLES